MQNYFFEICLGFTVAILEAILCVSLVSMGLINFLKYEYSNCLLYVCKIFIYSMHIKFTIVGDMWSEYDFLRFFIFDLDYDLDLEVQKRWKFVLCFLICLWIIFTSCLIPFTLVSNLTAICYIMITYFNDGGHLGRHLGFLSSH